VESIAAVLEDPRRDLLGAVDRTGRAVVSAFVEAPTFGGASWLSHASFMAGIDITDPASYATLLTQSRPTLPKLFGDAGYRTIALMPGLKNEWPEGAFYGFDTIYGASRLAYTGPDFGWWRIPDQFALATLDDLELAPGDRAPVFVFFPTISTHMPFRPTPPYQADWHRIRSNEPYAPAELGDRLVESPEWTELRPSYAGTLAYTYAYWAGYLAERAERDFLLVLVGDHQPPASVSGEGVRWDVPVHVVTRDLDLVTRLVAHGFVPGLTPAPAPVARMHELSPLLLQ
jgi:phosphoglycerol transferase MdoB-like AlkP superfamily enzyme